jgi:hypothetical protein
MMILPPMLRNVEVTGYRCCRSLVEACGPMLLLGREAGIYANIHLREEITPCQNSGSPLSPIRPSPLGAVALIKSQFLDPLGF